MNNKGISLVSVLIASSMLGVVALGVMRLSTSMNDIHQDGKANTDSVELYRMATNLIDHPHHCRVSLAKTQPNGAEIFESDGVTLQLLPQTHPSKKVIMMTQQI